MKTYGNICIVANFQCHLWSFVFPGGCWRVVNHKSVPIERLRKLGLALQFVIKWLTDNNFRIRFSYFFFVFFLRMSYFEYLLIFIKRLGNDLCLHFSRFYFLLNSILVNSKCYFVYIFTKMFLFSLSLLGKLSYPTIICKY